MSKTETLAAPRNTEEQLVGLLHGAAIEYEGTRIQGLLCRAGDVVLSLHTTLGHIRELAEEHNGGPEYGSTGWGQVMEWCDIHLDGQRKQANSPICLKRSATWMQSQ